MGNASSFLRPAKELRGLARFGFVWPNYGPRTGAALQRLPVARATVYFASEVETPEGSVEHGLFCEGPHASRFEVTASCSQMIGFKLRIGALRALLGVPAGELTGRTLDLREVWGMDARNVADRMAIARAPSERVAILERALVERLRLRADDAAIVEVADVLERTDGRVAIAELAERSGYCRRTLVQKFYDCVGMSPKACARLSRARAALAMLGSSSGAVDWAELAVSFGYYDQAHMTHEFRDLLGFTPAAFVRNVESFRPEAHPSRGRHSLPRREQRLYKLLGMAPRRAQPGIAR